MKNAWEIGEDAEKDIEPEMEATLLIIRCLEKDRKWRQEDGQDDQNGITACFVIAGHGCCCSCCSGKRSSKTEIASYGCWCCCDSKFPFDQVSSDAECRFPISHPGINAPMKSPAFAGLNFTYGFVPKSCTFYTATNSMRLGNLSYLISILHCLIRCLHQRISS